MSLTLVTKPTGYPVTLEEVKNIANIQADDDDAVLYALLSSATEMAEKYTGRDFMQRTWDWGFDKFPAGGCDIVLPKTPVLSISSISYTDKSSSPEIQTMASSVYELDNGQTPARIHLKYNQAWPGYTLVNNGITVRFISGYEGLGSPQDLRGNIPEAVKIAISVMVSKLYDNRHDAELLKDMSAEALMLNAYRVWAL